MIDAEKKIRVCFIALKAYPIFNPEVESVFGGAEVDLYLLSTELAKDERFDVRFIVGNYGQSDQEVRENVTLYKSIDVRKSYILQGHKIWQAFRRADAQVYMHEACSLGTALAAFFCKTHKRAFVYRTASSLEASGKHSGKLSVRKFFIQWTFRQANTFIVQNEQDAVNALRTVKRTAKVIRNACRVYSIKTVRKSGVLWVGRSKPVKRPDLFIKLAKAFPDISFTMICQRSLDDDAYQSLVETARQIPNLEFLKRIPFQDVDHYFEQARISVNTSDSEGFPNTFIQSCKAGTAILSLNVNPDGFLNKHNCGFCAEGDWQRFTGKLSEWIQTDHAQSVGQNGLDYIQAHHDIATIIQQYKDIFANEAF
ncbi:MAG: glycosyltransferase family 4 protein [Planctomycetota bacterium]